MSAAYTPKAQNASRGVATTANTNATVATSLHSGANEWIGDRRATYSDRWCPALTVSPTPCPASTIGSAAVRRRATNQRPPNSAPATSSVIGTPAIPERPLLTFSFCTSFDRVAGERTVGRPRSPWRDRVEALVDRDLVEPVGRGARERAGEGGEEQGDRDRADGEAHDPRASRRSVTCAPRELDTRPGRISRSCSRSDAPYTTSGRTASTAPTVSAVMTPSPMPISACTPTIAPNTVVDGDAAGAADRVLERERERRQHDRHEPGDPGRDDDAAVRAREQHAEPRKTRYPPSAVTSAMLMTLRPSALEPAVGEDECLDHQHDADAERADPRTDEHRGEETSEEVAARPTRHRES